MRDVMRDVWIGWVIVVGFLGACGSDDDSTTGGGADGGAEASSSGSDGGDGRDGREGADDGPGAAPDGVDPTMLPELPEDCPELATGTVSYGGLDVHLWVGERTEMPTGPVLIYYHGTGGDGANAMGALPAATIDEVLELGGLVISPTGSTRSGDNTGNFVWFTGDFDVVDGLVACAIDQLNINTRRIYTTGSSAGALQASVMAYHRSGYLAASVPDSGGIIYTAQRVLQDPDHVPAVMTLHGAEGQDVVTVDFAIQSRYLYNDIVKIGGFAVNCDHGGGHVRSPADLDAAGWQFMKDHPFGVDPEPYADGLPDSFPSYCVIIE